MHNIFGDRFYATRKPAWHGLGQVFDNPLGAMEAVRAVGMNFQIEKFPLYAEINGATVNTGKYGIFREPLVDDPQARFYGVCSKDYAIIQNEDLARVLEPLTDVWPVETAGALNAGETMFLALKVGGVKIAGEDVEQYFTITDTRNGGTSLRIMYTPVRVVCQNTLVSGIRAATISQTLQHSEGLEADLVTRMQLIKKMQAAIKATNASFETLAATTISSDDVDSIIASAYPYPPRPKKGMLLDEVDPENGVSELGELYTEAASAQSTWQYYCERSDVFRSSARGLFDKICDKHNSVANTPWAAYNAVVEFADYREGADSVNISALFGARAIEKKRAFDAATAYIV